MRPERRPPASFEIDMATLVAERGANCDVLGLALVPCPRCGSCDTEHRISTPRHGDATWFSDGDAAYPR